MKITFSYKLAIALFILLVANSSKAEEKLVMAEPVKKLKSITDGYNKFCTSKVCKKQIKKLKQYARYQDAKAQLALGTAYFYGDGVKQNIERAIYWLKQASYNDSRGAAKYAQKSLHMLFEIFSNGYGVDADPTLATKYHQKLVAKDYAPILYQNALKRIEEGSVEEAIHLLERAKKSYLFKALYLLGTIYQEGSLVPQDLVKAADNYQHLVSKDYKDSRTRLSAIVTKLSSNNEAELTQVEQQKIDSFNTALNMEVITVNPHDKVKLDAMTLTINRFKRNRGKYTAATGSRIKGRSCGQTSNSCSGLTEEDLQDELNEETTTDPEQ